MYKNIDLTPMKKRQQFLKRLAVGCMALLAGAWPASAATNALAALKAGWERPARTYKPHTRWWWPGNALTKADITWQLEQMAAQGLGGVEIMNTWKMYERGNVEYLTPEFMDLVKHAVAEAQRLDLEVAITFSPGWGFGGAWVPQADQSKVLRMGSRDLEGGTRFSDALPRPSVRTFDKASGRWRIEPALAPLPNPIAAVVAGRITGPEQLDADSLTVLTARVPAGTTKIAWDVPPGRWRLMVFWLEYTGQQCSAQSFEPPPMVVDHLNQGAVQRYCDYLGGAFAQTLGAEFGRTVDSFFCDSFELSHPSGSLIWSTDTLAGFERYAGYDLTRYLPVLWFDIGPLTPRIRYDLGAYLSHLGLEAFFKTFNDWCTAHQIQARIQPHYRFTEELVQGAGATARPETEVTTCRFESVADPRKATASGARFYGRDIVSAEAYTFIHPARYRTDLQDLKIATDAFLRDGITQFYNHGYFASPELHVAPSRDFPWANRISHWNTWWPYYHHVAAYVARCCALLRPGRLVADVLIYSPQATQWSERAVWGSARRVMPYGDLAKTLVANGYDFDIVNDDLLQHRAVFHDGQIEINGHARRVLILPRATVMPIETLRAIRAFAQAGGTVVALDARPAAAAGLQQHEENDRELKQIVASLFSTDPAHPSGGIFLAYRIDRAPFNPGRQPSRPTPPLTAEQRQLLAVLERVTPPDFALAGRAQSDGLTFIHKRTDDVDVYFVCNLQPQRVATEVTFRVTGKTPQRWNAITGQIAAVPRCRAEGGGTTIPVAFEPWESAFYVFAPGQLSASAAGAAAPESEPFAITGMWQMKLEGYGFESFATNVNVLASWTENPRTRHFSGTGRYEIEFTLPTGRFAPCLLDLGQVGTVADVELNGASVGVAWMVPYRLDITRAVRPGLNRLVVRVTNTLINYVSGLKEPPDVPAELQPRLGQARPALYSHSGWARTEMTETNLPPSGLLGPVRILFQPTP